MSQAQLASPWAGSIFLNIVSYSTGYNAQLTSAQLQRGTEWYPIKALQNDFTFTALFNSQANYIAFQNFLVNHYSNFSAANSAQSILRFYWPELNLDYAGVIQNFEMGAKKWEFTPTRSYTMQLMRDSIFTTTGAFSNTQSWQDIYGTSLIDNYKIPGTPASGDTILTGNPPAAGSGD